MGDGGDEVTSTSDNDIADPDKAAKSRRSSRKKSKAGMSLDIQQVDGADDLIHRSDLIHQVDGGDEATSTSDEDITDPDEAAKSRRSSRKKSKVLHFAESGSDTDDGCWKPPKKK